MKLNRVIGSWFFILVLMLIGCDGGGGGGKQANDTVMSNWNGQWTNAAQFVDDPSMAAAYGLIAVAANEMSPEVSITYTADDVAWFMASMYHADFGNASFKNGQVTFYDEGGGIVCQGYYRFEGTETVELFGESFIWYKFECVTEEDACAAYHYLILTAVHSHGGDMSHFHFRYGSEGFDELIHGASKGLWWPTMGESTITAGDMAEELTEGVQMMAAFMLQSLTMWTADWVGFQPFLDDPAFDPVYESVSEAAPGYTPAEVKALFAQMFYSDFGGISVTGQSFGFYEPAFETLVGQCDYQFAGTASFIHDGEAAPFYKFLRSSADVSCPTYVLAMQPHQDLPGSIKHWHMRYGDVGFDDLLNNPDLQMWWPTYGPAGITVDQVAASFPAPEELAEMLPARVVDQVDSQLITYVTSEGETPGQLTMPEDCVEVEGGQEKFCLCQAVAFRITQILAQLWPDGVFRSYDVRIETGWSTDGPEEFWGADKLGIAELIYSDPITPAKDLTLADSWYRATILSTGLTYTFYGTDGIYIEDFLELRAKNKNGTATPDELARMKALRAQIAQTIQTIPFNDMFDIEQR